MKNCSNPSLTVVERFDALLFLMSLLLTSVMVCHECTVYYNDRISCNLTIFVVEL